MAGILRFRIRGPVSGPAYVHGAAFPALWDALKAAEIKIPHPGRDVTTLPKFKVD